MYNCRRLNLHGSDVLIAAYGVGFQHVPPGIQCPNAFGAIPMVCPTGTRPEIEPCGMSSPIFGRRRYNIAALSRTVLFKGKERLSITSSSLSFFSLFHVVPRALASTFLLIIRHWHCQSVCAESELLCAIRLALAKMKARVCANKARCVDNCVFHAFDNFKP